MPLLSRFCSGREPLAIGRGELAAVRVAHAGLLVSQMLLIAIGAGRASWSDLTVSDAMVDAGLLPRLAGLNGVTLRVRRVGCGCGLRAEGGYGDGHKSGGEKNRFQGHCISFRLCCYCESELPSFWFCHSNPNGLETVAPSWRFRSFPPHLAAMDSAVAAYEHAASLLT